MEVLDSYHKLSTTKPPTTTAGEIPVLPPPLLFCLLVYLFVCFQLLSSTMLISTSMSMVTMWRSTTEAMRLVSGEGYNIFKYGEIWGGGNKVKLMIPTRFPISCHI